MLFCLQSMKWVDLFVGVDVSQTMPVVSTACAMIQCKISGAPIMEGDIQHFSLVKCQGMEGNCSLLVHPCCTITGVTCAHIVHVCVHDYGRASHASVRVTMLTGIHTAKQVG